MRSLFLLGNLHPIQAIALDSAMQPMCYTAYSCPNKQAIIGRLSSPVPIKNLQKSSKSTYITLIYLAFAQRNRIGLWLSDSRIPTDSGFGTSRFSTIVPRKLAIETYSPAIFTLSPAIVSDSGFGTNDFVVVSGFENLAPAIVSDSGFQSESSRSSLVFD